MLAEGLSQAPVIQGFMSDRSVCLCFASLSFIAVTREARKKVSSLTALNSAKLCSWGRRASGREEEGTGSHSHALRGDCWVESACTGLGGLCGQDAGERASPEGNP